MLWALALLGFLPMAFVFSDTSTHAPEPEGADDSSDLDESQPEMTTSMFDVGSVPDDGFVPDDGSIRVDELTGHYDTVSDGSETTFEDFSITEDDITLHLTDDGSGEFIVEPVEDGAGVPVGVSLSYVHGNTETTLNFLGLNDVPAENITIGITSQDTAEETLYGLETLGDFGAIEPLDPEMPGVANWGDETHYPPIAPNDPDIPAVPAGIYDPNEVVLKPHEPEGLI